MHGDAESKLAPIFPRQRRTVQNNASSGRLDTCGGLLKLLDIQTFHLLRVSCIFLNFFFTFCYFCREIVVLFIFIH